jgi:hypothetical protein
MKVPVGVFEDEYDDFRRGRTVEGEYQCKAPTAEKMEELVKSAVSGGTDIVQDAADGTVAMDLLKNVASQPGVAAACCGNSKKQIKQIRYKHVWAVA